MMQQARCTRAMGWSLLLMLSTATADTVAPAQTVSRESPITMKANEDFWIGDFAALERTNTELREKGGYTLEGRPEIAMFRIGLNNVFDAAVTPRELYLQELEALTLQWTTQYPQSALAHTLHAKALLKHAWSYRGNGFVKDVPPHSWKEFERYLRRAFDFLKTHGDVTLNDSYAHLTLLEIGKALSFDRKQMEVIAQDGLRRNPRDTELYFAMAGTLMPKWGGDTRTLDKYIRQVTVQTQEQYGTGMYAWLYSSAAMNEYGHALFQRSAADWSMMKQGYEDILQRFPDAIGRRNRYAYFACMAKDKPTLLAQLDKIGSQFDAGEWGENGERSLEGCQRWASET